MRASVCSGAFRPMKECGAVAGEPSAQHVRAPSWVWSCAVCRGPATVGCVKSIPSRDLSAPADRALLADLATLLPDTTDDLPA